MKKLLFVIALLTGFFALPATAKTAPVQSLQDFSISQPSQTLLIKILSNVQLNKNLMLHEGYYVLGQIMDVSNSTFVFMPIKYQNFHNEVFEINGNYPAKFVEMVDASGKVPAQGLIPKDSKFLLDFVMVDEPQNNEIGAKYQNAGTPENGVSSLVNQSEAVIYDGSIPKTMKEFPGIKLNSFDNGSNFNIPKKLIIDYEKRDSNINSLKY
jgi:hypothetical protein